MCTPRVTAPRCRICASPRRSHAPCSRYPSSDCAYLRATSPLSARRIVGIHSGPGGGTASNGVPWRTGPRACGPRGHSHASLPPTRRSLAGLLTRPRHIVCTAAHPACYAHTTAHCAHTRQVGTACCIDRARLCERPTSVHIASTVAWCLASPCACFVRWHVTRLGVVPLLGLFA